MKVSLKDVKLDLKLDWEHIAYVKLTTTETISCPICISTNNDIILPKILRCHHILCLPCLLTYYVDCKQCCPLCNRNICLKEIKRIDINSCEIHSSDVLDLVLLKKDTKTFKTDYVEPKICKEEGLDDFLNNKKWASEAKLEQIFLTDLQSIYTEPHMQEIDSLIVEFCEFIQMKALEKLHEATNMTHPNIGRKTIQKQINKNAEYYYFYQMKEGFNVFLHPIDTEYLVKNAKFEIDRLEPILFVI